jgi:hypothetical protein
MESNRVFDPIFGMSIKNYPIFEKNFLHLLVKIWAYKTQIGPIKPELKPFLGRVPAKI